MFEGLLSFVHVIAILIFVIIATFVLIIFLPKPKCYFEYRDICKELEFLSDESNIKIMKEELLKLFDSEQKRNYHHIYNNNTIQNTENITESYRLFRTIPYVRNITIAKLETKMNMGNNKGSSNLANDTLRCVLPIKVSGCKKSGIWVDGEIKFFTEGNWIIYDNSREHSIFNKHKRNETFLLIIDVDRPSWLPIGISTEENDLVI